ncbi:MAG TPA: enoyl-CoA hydratase-related protein [Burkholderiaceae bacterium]|nr:enoyl-CoA hydratase-related protein [Burkholderiaceae bacterium]
MTTQTDVREFSGFEAVQLNMTGSIARLTLNRPQSLNALNDTMFREIPAAIEQAAGAHARVLLITGAGRAFCSGADLVARRMEFAETPAQREQQNRASFERVIRLVNTLHEAPMPTVAAINGVAAGGGVGIALGCDVTLMIRSARFVLTFVPKLGIVPDVAATWLMSRAAGRAKTMIASLLGDSISSDEADRWGLVSRVIDDASFDADVRTICERLANTPQAAVRDTRKLVDLATEMPLREHIGIERDLQVHLVGAPDFVEGVTAFREKRTPKFSAR